MSLDKTIERRYARGRNGSVKTKLKAGNWKVAFTFASEFNPIGQSPIAKLSRKLSAMNFILSLPGLGLPSFL